MDNTATVITHRTPEPGYVFENAIVGGVIPKEFIKPIDDYRKLCSQVCWYICRRHQHSVMDLITMSTRLNWPLRLPAPWLKKECAKLILG